MRGSAEMGSAWPFEGGISAAQTRCFPYCITWILTKPPPPPKKKTLPSPGDLGHVFFLPETPPILGRADSAKQTRASLGGKKALQLVLFNKCWVHF